MKLEYKVTTTAGIPTTTEQEEAYLNEHGKEGWQLTFREVTVTPTEPKQTQDQVAQELKMFYRWYFMRLVATL